MTEQQAYTPLEATVPPRSAEDVLSEEQWKTLFSLTDTFIPTIRGLDPGNNSRESIISDKLVPVAQLNHVVSSLARRLRHDNSTLDPAAATQLAYRFYEENTSSNPLFREDLRYSLANYVHDEGVKGIILVLNILKYDLFPLFGLFFLFFFLFFFFFFYFFLFFFIFSLPC